MSDYEPPAEQVEALAKELHDEYSRGYAPNVVKWCAATMEAQQGCRAEARFVLRLQNERENRLLAFIERVANRPAYAVSPELRCEAQRALAAHAKLDAAEGPSVGDAFRLAEASRFVDDAEPDVHIRKSAWDTLKAAVEREEKR